MVPNGRPLEVLVRTRSAGQVLWRAPPQFKRLLGLTAASGVLRLLLGVVFTVIYATTDFSATYQRLGVPAEEAGRMGTMTEQMRGCSIAFGAIGLAVLVGLYLMECVLLKKGANWARIQGIVPAVLGVVTFLSNFFEFWLYGQWVIVLIAIVVILVAVNIAWSVTAFRARSTTGSRSSRATPGEARACPRSCLPRCRRGWPTGLQCPRLVEVIGGC